MKKRNGFVSNSSSSSFVIALPKSYQLSEEEMEQIRGEIEDYDCYFSYYEELAEKSGDTETLDEREKIQKMLESGNFSEEEDLDPVNDKVMNSDIQKGLNFLTSEGYFWSDRYSWEKYNVPTYTAAKCIVEVLGKKIKITSLDGGSGSGQIVNILADSLKDTKAMNLVKENFDQSP